MSASTQEIDRLINQSYKQGFVTELETDTFPVGLDEAVIHKLSKVKNEPEFMLEYRLKAFRHWQTMTPPKWQFLNIEPIDYQAISYYSAPKRKEDGPKSLDEIDPEVLAAYKKLGIPLDEQEKLAGHRCRVRQRIGGDDLQRQTERCRRYFLPDFRSLARPSRANQTISGFSRTTHR